MPGRPADDAIVLECKTCGARIGGNNIHPGLIVMFRRRHEGHELVETGVG